MKLLKKYEEEEEEEDVDEDEESGFSFILSALSIHHLKIKILTYNKK